MANHTSEKPEEVTMVSSEELRLGVGEMINRVKYRNERITVTRRGKAVMALVPMEDLELLERAKTAESSGKQESDPTPPRRIGQYGPGHMR